MNGLKSLSTFALKICKGKALHAKRLIKLSILVILLLVVGVNIVVSYYQMRQFALQEAQEKANILIQHNLAIHTFYTHQLKPAVIKDLKEPVGNDYFTPEWMSSTYAVREIDTYFRQLSQFDDYYYKEAAINARYPANEADEYEQIFLNRLQDDAALQEDVQFRIIDGEPYFVTMVRGESMTDECLVCHSTPENAPMEMVDVYGDQRSFNREVDEVVSAISIHIPLSVAFQRANREFFILSATLGATLFILFFIFNRILNVLLAQPIQDIREKAIAIAENEDLLGQTIALPRVHELRGLASAFNQLSVNLRSNKDELEEIIENRTKSLYKNQRFLDEILSTLPNMVSLADFRTKKYLYVNREMSIFMDLPVQEVLSQGTPFFEKKLHPESMEDYNLFQQELAQKKDSQVSKRYFQIKNKDENWVWLESRAVVFEWGADGLPDQILFISRDVTSQRQAEEKLKYLGLHDSLTGVYNRNAFDAALEDMEDIKYFPLTVMMADVDNLKMQNDRFGHASGDHLLKLIAETLQFVLRESDMIARIGGDEFVVLLPNTTEKVASEIKERITAELSIVMKNHQVVTSGLSIGLITVENPNKLDGIMPIVDERMYAEKAKRKNG